MSFLSRRDRNRPYVIGQFDVVGAVVHDDGEDVLKFNVPLTAKQQNAIAELVSMPEVQVSVVIAVSSKDGAE